MRRWRESRVLNNGWYRGANRVNCFVELAMLSILLENIMVMCRSSIG